MNIFKKHNRKGQLYPVIKEWNLLRVIACLCIVFLHSTTLNSRHAGHPEIDYYDVFRAIICFATPTFIVLSEIILANRYPDRLPNQFWQKRLKFIFLPFVSFAIFDAFNAKYFNPNVFLELKIFNNIVMGTFIGYFIFIIFQFYVLHYLVVRFKPSMKWLLPVSLLTMAVHLSFMKMNIPFVHEHQALLKLPFTAWFGYFTIAYIIGKHYKKLQQELLTYRWLTLILAALSVLYFYFSFESGNARINSLRLDLFPVVLSFSAAILAWGQLIPNFRIIQFISNYSFGIYLLHWQVLRHLAPYTVTWFNHTSSRVLTLFFMGLVISVTIIKLISLLPFGSMIVGNIKKLSPKLKQTRDTAQVA